MEYIGYLAGIIKLIIYKVGYGKRLSIKGIIKMASTSSIVIRKSGKINLGKKISISKNVSISAMEGAKISIGSGTGLNQNTKIVSLDEIIIGKNVLIGPNVCIYDHDHNYKDTSTEFIKNKGYVCKSIKIDDNVWIGAGAVILKGVHIESGSVIGAGTIVNDDVSKNTLVYNQIMIVKRQYQGVS